MSRVVLLLGLVVTAPARAATVTINFDVDPLGDPIPDGTIVDTVYQVFGVTFRRVTNGVSACSGTNVYANAAQPFASLPNNVSICDAAANGSDFNEGTGLVEGVTASFDRLSHRVTRVEHLAISLDERT